MVGWASAGISLGTFAFSCTLACVKPMRREHTRGGSHSSPVESSYPMGNYGNRNQAYQQNDWDKNQSYNGVIKEFYATQASMWWFLKHSWIPLECQKVYKKNLDEILDLCFPNQTISSTHKTYDCDIQEQPTSHHHSKISISGPVTLQKKRGFYESRNTLYEYVGVESIIFTFLESSLRQRPFYKDWHIFLWIYVF